MDCEIRDAFETNYFSIIEMQLDLSGRYGNGNPGPIFREYMKSLKEVVDEGCPSLGYIPVLAFSRTKERLELEVKKSYTPV